MGVGDGVTRDEAEARYAKWTHFFLSHFPKDDAVVWEGTPFAKWIKEQDAVGSPVNPPICSPLTATEKAKDSDQNSNAPANTTASDDHTQSQ